MRAPLIPAILLLPLLGAAFARQPAEPTITPTPAAPAQGTLFRVHVRWPSGAPRPDSVGGEFAGEPLHFVADSSGTFVAIAAAPLDAADTLSVRVVAVARGERTSHVAPIPVGRGAYRVERLRVAPQFGRPLPPATAARVAGESERALDVARTAHATPRLWRQPLASPRSTRVTSPFGRGREYNGRVTGRHTGTDYAGAVGAPVRAPARGVVRIVDRFYLGGNVVYLDHGGGLSSAYLHLSRAAVAPGDTVERGATIGEVGATGRVTGPHLHWILRYGGIAVDGARAVADGLP